MDKKDYKKKENDQPKKIAETFEQMGLKESLLRGIFSYGFEKPSNIQKRAIVPMIEGRDIVAQSQSGTGSKNSFLNFSNFFSFFLIYCKIKL